MRPAGGRQAEPAAGQRVERLVQQHRRYHCRGERDRDERKVLGEENVLVCGPQVRCPHHRDDGGHRQRRIARQGRSRK
jgi:hypothetical protein